MSRIVYSSLLIVLLVPIPPRVGAETKTILIDGVTAYVNENVITIGDVMVVFQPVQRQLVQSFSGAALQDKLKTSYDLALQSLVERQLILDYYTSQDLQLPDWIIDQRVNEIIADMFGGDRTEFMEALAKDHMSYDQWREQVQNNIILSYMRQLKVENNVKVAPGDVFRSYQEHQAEYQRPAEVRIRMIVLPKKDEETQETRTRGDADAIHKALIAGKDFASLATAHSSGSNASRGGDWGWIEPRMLRSQLARVLRSLKPSQFSEVIETPDSYYLLKLEGRKSAAIAPFDEVQATVKKALRREESERLYTTWLTGLRRDAYIKILDVSLF